MTTARTTSTSRRPKAAAPDLRFIFKTEDISAPFATPLLTVRADIAQHIALNHDGTVRSAADDRRGTRPGGYGLRNCSWTSRWDGLAGGWDSFALTAQAELHNDWYGWQADFREPFSVRLDRAEAMVKVLRKVETRLSRIAGQYGQPGGFAEWAARVLSATGARGTSRPFGRLTSARMTSTAAAASGWTPTASAPGWTVSWPRSARPTAEASPQPDRAGQAAGPAAPARRAQRGSVPTQHASPGNPAGPSNPREKPGLTGVNAGLAGFINRRDVAVIVTVGADLWWTLEKLSVIAAEALGDPLASSTLLSWVKHQACSSTAAISSRTRSTCRGPENSR